MVADLMTWVAYVSMVLIGSVPETPDVGGGWVVFTLEVS